VPAKGLARAEAARPAASRSPVALSLRFGIGADPPPEKYLLCIRRYQGGARVNPTGLLHSLCTWWAQEMAAATRTGKSPGLFCRQVVNPRQCSRFVGDPFLADLAALAAFTDRCRPGLDEVRRRPASPSKRGARAYRTPPPGGRGGAGGGGGGGGRQYFRGAGCLA
jgi:hypothetical protein